MSSVKLINPKAEVARANHALGIISEATNGLRDLLKTNLGPEGTLKMLVSGSGDIRMTKDGKCLMGEMQMTNPICSLIGRTVTAHDDTVGDGTTSSVLLICQLVEEGIRQIKDGVHPQCLVDGFRTARDLLLEELERFKLNIEIDRSVLLGVARTALRTKISVQFAEDIVDAVLCCPDLHMIEIMEMLHQTDMESRMVKGLVLDHAPRHPDMPKSLKNAFILSCNVSMEYEKSEVNSSFTYKNANTREKLVLAERRFCDDNVQRVISLKKSVCTSDQGFVLINQKGIDPISLEALSKENIFALRRAKRRNMERIPLACGGRTVNSLEDLTEDCLGFAGTVYQMSLGDDNFTFIEDCQKPKSVSLLLKGPNKHTLTQLKDAVRDGLRAVKNAVDDASVVPGAGSFELRGNLLLKSLLPTIPAKEKPGVEAFANSLLIIPKTLTFNAGHDHHETISLLVDASREDFHPGIDISTGGLLDPAKEAIFDNTVVKRQTINSACVMASNLLLVDEIMRAGISSVKSGLQQ